MYRNIAFLILFPIITFQLEGQKMVYDSLIIEFGNKYSTVINTSVDNIRDLRNLSSNCVGITEKTKYAFIPVDNLIVLKRPLTKEISLMFLQKPDSVIGKKYQLEINEFVIESRKKGLFQSTYTCNAAISVYSLDSALKSHFTGTLLYENEITLSPKRKHSELAYENIIDNWKTQFYIDFQQINTCLDKDQVCSLSNFRKELNASKKNMLINVESCIYPGSWLIDGEIIFSRPEAQRIFFRQAYSLRYRNEKKYEALETSIYNKQNFFRVSDAFLFTLKSKFFFGLNRWREDYYKNRGLEDVILFDLSFSQNIMWNRFFKNGITAGLGVMEDLTYIYSEHFVFRPYAVVQIGVKL